MLVNACLKRMLIAPEKLFIWTGWFQNLTRFLEVSKSLLGISLSQSRLKRRSLHSQCTVLVFLSRQSEQERYQREEDFYYTEVYQEADQSSAPTGCHSPSSPSHQRSSPPTPEPLQPSPLSQSAPSSFWQVHSEHSYQVGQRDTSTSYWGPRDMSTGARLARLLIHYKGLTVTCFQYGSCEPWYYHDYGHLPHLRCFGRLSHIIVFPC